jgi:hypothetical protein
MKYLFVEHDLNIENDSNYLITKQYKFNIKGFDIIFPLCPSECLAIYDCGLQ